MAITKVRVQKGSRGKPGRIVWKKVTLVDSSASETPIGKFFIVIIAIETIVLFVKSLS